MTRTPIAVAVAAVTAACSFVAGDAHAQAVTATVAAPAPAVAVSDSSGAVRPGFSTAGYLGFDYVGSGAGAAFAFGARAGYSLPMHLYVGGDLGYSVASFNFFHLQAEAGYDIGISSVPALLIRPYLGIGFNYFAAPSICSPILNLCVSSGGGASFLLSPGVVGTYSILHNVFVGADLRVPIFLGSVTTAGFGLLATGGYQF
jgi:hypothetical protein